MKNLFIIVLTLVFCSAVYADSNNSGASEVVPQYFNFSGVSCDNTNVVTAAAGGADQNSDSVATYNTELHSISYKYEAENAGSSFLLTFQHLSKWGDWVAFVPAKTITCAGASGSGTAPISFPVAADIRCVRSSDATYVTTLNALVINKY
jgi:hypothetical protein